MTHAETVLRDLSIFILGINVALIVLFGIFYFGQTQLITTVDLMRLKLELIQTTLRVYAERDISDHRILSQQVALLSERVVQMPFGAPTTDFETEFGDTGGESNLPIQYTWQIQLFPDDEIPEVNETEDPIETAMRVWEDKE